MALALSGCSGTVQLSQRRADYDAVLKIPAQAQAVLAEKTSLVDGLLSRTSAPDAAPYPALRAYLATMTRQAAALQAVQAKGAAFEGDFDFFAATHATVSSQQATDWAAYQTLNDRFPPIGHEIRSDAKVFNGAAEQFDALTKASNIFALDQATLDASLAAFRDRMDRSLKRMEERVRVDRQTVDFYQGTSLDPVVKGQKQSILESMEEHLFKTEGLVRRTLEQADAVQASCPAGAWLWAGPGLPNDGSVLAKLWSERDAFDRRRAEFKSLADSFDAAGQSAP